MLEKSRCDAILMSRTHKRVIVKLAVNHICINTQSGENYLQN